VVTSGSRRLHFDFDVRSTSTRPIGQLSLTRSNASYKSSTATTFTWTRSTATWTGTGTWNGHSGYAFSASAADAGRMSGDEDESRDVRARDWLQVTVRDHDGKVVVSIAGNVTSGDIAIARASRADERDWSHRARPE